MSAEYFIDAIDYGMGCQLVSCDPDKANLLAWRNDPAIWKWCRQYTLRDECQHQDWAKSLASNKTIKMFLITHLSKYVGVCGFTDIDHLNQRAEFSLYIGPDFQGLGLGKAALNTLFTHGFLDMNFHSIWGETFDGNPAQKLFLDIGMRPDGKHRDFYFREGKFIDAWIYSVVRSDWLSNWKELPQKVIRSSSRTKYGADKPEYARFHAKSNK